MSTADLILHNGKITTNDGPSEAESIAFLGGRVASVGSEGDVFKLRGAATTVIDLGGRRAIPGLNDSHLHLIRGGTRSTSSRTAAETSVSSLMTTR